MAIFASSSTITTQTVPLITVDLSEIQNNYVLQWDSELGSFVARTSTIQPIVNLSNSSQVTGILSVENGGTNNNVYQEGDLIVAKTTNGDIKLDSLEIDNGINQKFLSIVNNMPSWVDTTTIKNVIQTRIVSVTDQNTNIGGNIPVNAILTKVRIAVTSEYTNTTLTIGTNTVPDDIVTLGESALSQLVIYAVELNKFYETPTQLTVFLDGDKDGSLQVFLEYILT